jgi:hypothetical protein
LGAAHPNDARGSAFGSREEVAGPSNPGPEGRPTAQRALFGCGNIEITARLLGLVNNPGQEYEQEVETANLARTTKNTYLLHANNFVRWLAGEFTPGARNS